MILFYLFEICHLSNLNNIFLSFYYKRHKTRQRDMPLSCYHCSSSSNLPSNGGLLPDSPLLYSIPLIILLFQLLFKMLGPEQHSKKAPKNPPNYFQYYFRLCKVDQIDALVMILCALNKAGTAFVRVQNFELLTCSITLLFRGKGTTQ